MSGSSNSRRQSSHIGKSFIDVFCLSYGSDESNVNLAPQSVQDVNAYPDLRPCERISSRQLSQVAVSVGIETALPPGEDLIMRKPSGRCTSASSVLIPSISARGGSLSSSAPSSSSPRSLSIMTSEPLFHTLPLIPSPDAARYTAGRKPTPWTVPFMWIRVPLVMIKQ